MTGGPAASAPTLTLADGSSWVIVAGDPDAAPVIETLAAIMRLAPADEPPLLRADGSAVPPVRGSAGWPARELRVVVRDGPEARLPADTRGDGPVLVAVHPPVDRAMHMIAAERVAQTIARDAQRRGGLLVHGGLAEWRGCGAVLAGAGTVGKSTASRRLPAPWRSWSDDATLVVRDPGGRLRAHPWPTWSRFYWGEGEGRWDVAASLPLGAVFFLAQAPDDSVTPAHHDAQALAMLMECVAAVSSGMRRGFDADQTRALSAEQLANCEAVVAETPMYRLELSLNGSFWTLLEPLLDEAIRSGRTLRAQEPLPDDGDILIVALSGASMIPTLREPELLEVAAPDGRPLRVGDIVYFRSPKNGIMVVHRAVSVSAVGIRTRGDNCTAVDEWVLRPDEVLGRVVGTRRGTRRRAVAGGLAGQAVAVAARARRAADRGLSPRLHDAYLRLARSGALRAAWARLAPPHLQPRLVRFGSGYLVTEKILLGGREVARFDRVRQEWTIQRPFRLLLDEAALPRFPRPPRPEPAPPPAGEGPA